MRTVIVTVDPKDAGAHPFTTSPAGSATTLARHLASHPLVSRAGVFRMPTLHATGTGGLEVLAAAAQQSAALVSASAGAHVVHTLDLASAAAALRARRTSGVPVVARVRLAGVKLDGSARASVSAVAQSVDAVQAPTTADAEIVRRLGVPSERIVVALDSALVAHDVSAEVGAPNHYSPHGNPVLTVLSGVPRGRPCRAALISALRQFDRLTVTIPDTDAGSTAAAALLNASRRYSVSDRLHLCGHISSRQTAQLLDRSAVVLAACEEPADVTGPLTAMARGRALLARPNGGIEDVVVDGVTGRTVDMADAEAVLAVLVQTVGDAFRCGAWGVAGLDRLRSRFCPRIVIDALTRAYDDVATGMTGRRSGRAVGQLTAS